MGREDLVLGGSMTDGPNLRGVPSSMSDRESDRLWTTLDKMDSRLSDIRKDLHEIAEIKVTVKGHEQTLARFGNRLDLHDSAIHNLELNYSGFKGDKRAMERNIQDLHDRVDDVEDSVDKNTIKVVHNEGQKDFGGAALKVVVGLMVTLLIWAITKAK